MKWRSGLLQSHIYALVALTALCLAACAGFAQPVTPTSAPTQPVVKVEALALGTSWVSVAVDGREVYEGTMRPGERRSWTGKRIIRMRAGNAGAIRVAHNGRQLGLFGRSGEVLGRSFVPPPAQAAPKPVPVAQPAPEPKPATPPDAPKPVPTRTPPPETTAEESTPEPAEQPDWLTAGKASEYLQVAVLAALLVVALLVLMAVWRERRLTESMARPAHANSKRIEMLASEKLAEGRTLYLVRIDGRQFVIGDGGLHSLGEMPEDSPNDDDAHPL